MSGTDGSEPGFTPLDRLVDSLRCRDAASDGQARASAILWPDGNREWERLLPILRGRGAGRAPMTIYGGPVVESRSQTVIAGRIGARISIGRASSLTFRPNRRSQCLAVAK